jgi:hypothetical protein
MEVAKKMRGIAKLLFGEEADRLLGLFDGDGDGFGLAEQARRSGEWCASTPGRGSAADAARGAGRQHGLRREIVVREFRSR